MRHSTIRRSAGVGLSAIALAAGWLAGTQRVPAQTTSAVDLAIQWSNERQYDGPPYTTIQDVVKRAEAVAVVTVSRVDGPLWNSTDGQPWLGNSTEAPNVYSIVHVNVDSVWKGTVSGASIDVYTPGDASIRYENGVIPPDTTISGGFAVGGQYIVVLAHNVFPFEAGDRSEWELAADFFGNWRISGTDGIDAYTPLSASIDAIRSAVGCKSGQCPIARSID